MESNKLQLCVAGWGWLSDTGLEWLGDRWMVKKGGTKGIPWLLDRKVAWVPTLRLRLSGQAQIEIAQRKNLKFSWTIFGSFILF